MLQGENGYVKDYRSTLSWEWFTDVNTAHLWEYIRLRVNYEPSRFRGMEIRRGEMLESLPRIALNTGLTVQKVRTALEHLKSTGEITCKATRYGMMIFAVKYAFFQDQGSADNTEVTRDTTLKQHGSNTEVTTYKEIKNKRNKETSLKEKINKKEKPTPEQIAEWEKKAEEAWKK